MFQYPQAYMSQWTKCFNIPILYTTSVSLNTVLCHHHFMETDIKKPFLRWKLLPGSAFSQNLPGKTTAPKQERKLLVKRQITVKSTHKRTEKTSLSITLTFT